MMSKKELEGLGFKVTDIYLNCGCNIMGKERVIMTAKEARELTKESQEKATKEQLSVILANVKENAKNGLFTYVWHHGNALFPSVVDRLRNLGYDVYNIRPEPLDIFRVKVEISWINE